LVYLLLDVNIFPSLQTLEGLVSGRRHARYQPVLEMISDLSQSVIEVGRVDHLVVLVLRRDGNKCIQGLLSQMLSDWLPRRCVG
jgi:ethanolamine utilization protein EutA (predicted chaperonin)